VKFYNKTLNKKFWSEDKEFDPEIRKKLMSITNDFIDKLNLEDVKIHDVTLTGSNSNYNYNKYSDLDVHVLIDYKDINEDEDLVKKALDGQRFMWNLRHNIELRDHGVEMYMQDKDEPHIASGLYSLMNDKWITEPSYNPPSIDKRDVYKKAKTFQDDVRILKEKLNAVKGESAKDLHDKANNLKKKISNMRRSGLDREGEFSIENLAFKILRNTNAIGDLIDIIANSYDKIYMENFKTFFEYYQGDPIMNPHMKNGKNINRVGLTKKHLNTLPKKYNHQCPHVNNLINGAANQIKLMGQPLLNTLGMYEVNFNPGEVRTLGNSGVEVAMYEDEESNCVGILRKK
tara:strand:- start:91 stop:1125 length:1035 start_codon:yes stop_codon:yes gene_type:complete